MAVLACTEIREPGIWRFDHLWQWGQVAEQFFQESAALCALIQLISARQTVDRPGNEQGDSASMRRQRSKL